MPRGQFATPLRVTSKIFTPLILLVMADLLHQAVATALFVYGTSKLAKALLLLALKMVSQLLPFPLIPNLLPLALSIRAFACGILNPDTWLSVLKVLMDTKIPSTPLHLHQTERISCLEVWTRRSRCGNWLRREVATQTTLLKEDGASKHSRVTR